MPYRPRSLGPLIVASLTLACSPDGPVTPTTPVPKYGQIQLTISTDGVDISPWGHELTIMPVGLFGSVPEYHNIPTNGTWVIRLRASLTYVVQLSNLPGNCASSEGDIWNVIVNPGQATEVALNLTCSRIEGILVSESLPQVQALALVYTDGSGVRDLGLGSAATWSPKGDFMAFVSQACGFDPSGYVCNSSLTLSTLHNVPSDLAGGRVGNFPAWHPGGRFIAFLDERKLYGVTLDAPPLVDLLAELPVDSAADLEWSRDGSRLAFTCMLTAPTDAAPARSDICLVRADGSGFEVLTSEPGSHLHPAWHPDGRIAFSTTRFGEVSVATMRSDGSGIARLTAGSDPAWSPDGNQLAVIRGGATPGLFVMNGDGSARLLASGRFTAPTWRP